MTSCTDLDPLLAEKAGGGALSPADAFRLDAHLAGCERCRAELAAFERTLGLVRLAPVGDAERARLAQLPAQVRAELRRAPLVTAFKRILVLGFAAAAVVVVIANKVVLPSARRGAERPAAAATATGWREPDVDALLQRVEQEHPELSGADENGLVRAERLADVAYEKALGGE